MPIKAGNQFIFFLFTIFNFVLFFVGAGVVSAGVYMIVITDDYNYINLPIIGAGAVLLVISCCSCQLRRSVGWLRCYIMIQFLIFAVMLAASLFLYFNQTKVVEWAEKAYDKLKEKDPETIEPYEDYLQNMKDHILWVAYGLFAFTLLIAASIITGWCYRESTISKTFEQNDKLLAEEKAKRRAEEIARIE